MRDRRKWLVPALCLVLLGAGCRGTETDAGGGAGSQEGETIQVGGEAANNHGQRDVAGQSSVDVDLNDFYFEPTVLSGEAGQMLTVRLSNAGQAPHTFTVEAQGVDVVLDPGASAEARVTLPDSGALLVICRFHAGQGMRGALSVGGDLTVGEGTVQEPAEDQGGGGGGGYDRY